MALLGKAVLINWSNVQLQNRSQYFAWHDREHMAARLRLPGFQRGRRLWAHEADRDVLNIYEVDNLGVLTGTAYSSAADSPSLAYRGAGKIITDAIRALAQVRYSHGIALGGCMLTIRFAELRNNDAHSLEAVLQATGVLSGIVGLHLCVADVLASSVITADRRGRPTAIPGCAILVEGTTMDALRACRETILFNEALTAAGCVGPFEAGLYGLQMAMTKLDLDQN